MTLSVLMAVYKSEKTEYLDMALQSVWTDQTCKPDQIVLVEDGELTDELSGVIRKWKELLGDILTIIKNTSNIGLTKSLNRGIQAVRSELIARMDSDDRSHPMRFERQKKFFESHPDIDIIGGTLQEVDENGNTLNIRHYPLTHEDVLNTMYKVSPLAHPTVMMRKKIFDNGLKYDERFRTSQDIALWYDAVCHGYKIANLPEITIYFRRAGNVYKRRSKAKAWNEFRIYLYGIYRLYGLFSTKYVYPISRFCFRLMPIFIVKWGYQSRLRHRIAEGKNTADK